VTPSRAGNQTVGVGQIALDHLGFGRERGPRRIPGEGADSVTAGEEFGDDLTSDGSGGAGDKNVLCLCHGTTVGSLAVNFRPQGGSRAA
jgi:hypothetical protein